MEESTSPELRPDMVATAIKFLLNPTVRSRALDDKKAFLKEKGLTNEEISAAIEKYNQVSVNQLVDPFVGVPSPVVAQQDISLLSRIFSGIPSVAIMAGLVYGSYLFYKRYIEPLMFPQVVHKHPYLVIDEKLRELEGSIEMLKNTLAMMEISIKKEIKSELSAYTGPNPAEVAAINELKSEISSIKALLLNRKQFPATPRLPSWQLDNEESQKTANGVDETSPVAVNGHQNEANLLNAEPTTVEASVTEATNGI